MDPQTNVDINPISLDEWIKLVEIDDELDFNSDILINPITRQKIYIEKGTVVQWLNPEEDDFIDFHFSEGKIFVNGFDDCLINKIKSIAKKLNSYVYEEGELLSSEIF